MGATGETPTPVLKSCRNDMVLVRVLADGPAAALFTAIEERLGSDIKLTRLSGPDSLFVFETRGQAAGSASIAHTAFPVKG